MGRLAHLWQHHRRATLAFALVAALTLAFAIRSAMFALHWSDPARRDQLVEPWMTPRFVAHSWKLPPATMQAALGDFAMPDRRRTLNDIASDRGVPVADLIAAIEAEIALYRSTLAPRP